MSAARAAVLALAAALPLTGCAKKIDGAKGEQTIRRTVVEEVGAQVRAVSCPRDVTAKAGGSFRCTVTGTDASRGEVIVRMRDDQGRVSVQAPFLHVSEVEEQIAGRLTARAGRRVTVSCPEIVEVARGGRFRCSATSRGARTARVRVVQRDARGNVSYTVTSLGT